jgi:signal transduction histidine kinase
MLLSLANDLIVMAQIKNGKFTKQETLFNIKDCIDEVVNIQIYKAQSLSIQIETNYDFDGDHMVFTDFHRIQ